MLQKHVSFSNQCPDLHNCESDYPIQQAFSTVINCLCNYKNSKSLFSVWLLRKMWEIFFTIFEPSQDCDLRKKVYLLNKPSTVHYFPRFSRQPNSVSNSKIN
ncbi:hypothetical protein ACB094_11G176900 [Castanea mollissima]